MTWTALALMAFAANSILCRMALSDQLIGPAEFTTIRLFSGALILSTLVGVRKPGQPRIGGNWLSAWALVLYAVPFSFAYLQLSAGMGALILFFAVQVTMIAGDMARGRRPLLREWLGLPMALTGLIFLLWPGVQAPEPWGAGLMTLAGVSWGYYSLRGKNNSDAVALTAGNFTRGSFLILPLMLFSLTGTSITLLGALLAIASGAIASGMGYVIWYRALRSIAATQAAVVQLLVPLLTAVAGVVLLGETFSLRLLISGTVIAGGVAVAVIPFRVSFQRPQTPFEANGDRHD